MAKEKTKERWIEAGYDLFARLGPEGVHIETIARSLLLNKSSFYHYFGTLEIFYEQLVQHHYSRFDMVMKIASSAPTLDPAYLNIVVKYKNIFMAQVQICRHSGKPLFFEALTKVNQKIDDSVIKLWSNHLGVTNIGVALLYLGFVRDTFYSRVTFENFDYAFLHELACESRHIVDEIRQGQLPLKKLDTIFRSKRRRLESKTELD